MVTNQVIDAVITQKIKKLTGDTDVADIDIPIYVSCNSVKKILVLSGGGIRGISFIGALSALYDSNILQSMHTFAGTSVGSLILFLYVIGYKPCELMDFVRALDIGKLKTINVPLFLDAYGLDSGDKIMKTMEKFMLSKNLKRDITFTELFRKTNKTFIVTSVNISEQKAEYFSHTTHPNMPVALAVRMSISIPFIFTPVKYNNCLYVDGGCIDNFPLKQFDEYLDELIGIYIINKIDPTNSAITLDGYVWDVINSTINGITSTSVNSYKKYIVGIDIGNISSINFDITPEIKSFMYNAGYRTLRDYVSHNTTNLYKNT